MGSFFSSSKKENKKWLCVFLFLACMLLPVTLRPNDIMINSWYHEVDLFNIFAFGICLIGGFLPWYVFDKWSKNKVFIVPAKAIGPLKLISIILIVSSLYSIIYILPYSVKSLLLGAADVRRSLYAGEGAIYPPNIFTTIAVAIAACNIYAILLFYIACITPSLKRYRIWLIISSFSYLFNCFAITARDGLIILPCFYLVFYLIFQNSFAFRINKRIKKQLRKIIIIAGSFLLIFSVSRFYKESGDINSLYSGTVGYVSQQRYVFDATIKGQDDFWGFECRFPLVNRLLGIEEYEVNRRDDSFEWSFGTMYAEFYDAFAWPGLILMSLAFIMYYYIGFKILIRRRSVFGTMLLFCVYFFIALTGMFYTRAGGAISMNIFYFTLSIVPFFVRNLLYIK